MNISLVVLGLSNWTGQTVTSFSYLMVQVMVQENIAVCAQCKCQRMFSAWLQRRMSCSCHAMPGHTLRGGEWLANGTSKNVGLGKFWQDLEISEAFLTSLEVSFFHGLFFLFLSLETFHQRVSGSDF